MVFHIDYNIISVISHYSSLSRVSEVQNLHSELSSPQKMPWITKWIQYFYLSYTLHHTVQGFNYLCLRKYCGKGKKLGTTIFSFSQNAFYNVKGLWFSWSLSNFLPACVQNLDESRNCLVKSQFTIVRCFGFGHVQNLWPGKLRIVFTITKTMIIQDAHTLLHNLKFSFHHKTKF